MSDFKLLLEKVRKCQLCAQQLALKPRPILQASSKSKILIAGQAPVIIKHDKGIPFDDRNGQRLGRWLGVITICFTRNSNLSLNQWSLYPGKRKSGNLAPITLCT